MFAAAIAKAPGMRLGIVMFEQEHQQMEYGCQPWHQRWKLLAVDGAQLNTPESSQVTHLRPEVLLENWWTSLPSGSTSLQKQWGNRSKSKHVHMLLHSHTSFHICFDTYTSPSHLYEWNTISQETRLAAASNDEWLFCQHQAFPSRTGQGHA